MALRNEMESINRRWAKSVELDKAGYFDTLEREQYDKCLKELSGLVQRATTIWEILYLECPPMLVGLDYLEK